MVFRRIIIALSLASALSLPTLAQAAWQVPTGVSEDKGHKGDGPRPKPGPREDGDDD